MKKLLILFFICGVMYSQTQIIVYKDVTFEADSVSNTLTLDRGLFLKGLIVPQGLSNSYMFNVSKDGNNFYPLWTEQYPRYAVVVDSSESNAFMLPQSVFEIWKYYKVVIDNKRSDTTSVTAVLGGAR